MQSRLVTTVEPALLLASLFPLFSLVAARSSDHQDTPTTVARPGIDTTDVYVFPSPNDASKVVLAMDVWPLIPAGQGASTSFDPGAMYEFNIGVGHDFHKDYVIQFKATGVAPNQQITMFGPGKPAVDGTQSRFITGTGTFAYDHSSDLPGGIRAFAGPREDPSDAR